MRFVRERLLRLIGSVRQRRADADLQEELRAHLDLAADDARRRRRPDVDAERVARLRAGQQPSNQAVAESGLTCKRPRRPRRACQRSQSL